jgi:nicotinate phosphoribosyltransferase
MYARSFPTSFTTLIDTYSSINSGLKNTIIIAKALEEAKITKIGVRLDSGDLVK